MRVGEKLAARLDDAEDVEDWFSCIGDSHHAEILRLYAKVGVCLEAQSNVFR